ncbi:uncharacterized protein TNCV_1913001 [Trichonephila clavipes]|nr:uncharacterized protein TNCV_1913001 [Trichonephila clavipes]
MNLLNCKELLISEKESLPALTCSPSQKFSASSEPYEFVYFSGKLNFSQRGSRSPLRELPLTPTHRRFRLEWCHTRGNWTAAEGNQVVFSGESRFNLSSDDNVCGDPVVNASILPLLYSDTPVPQLE